MPIWVPATCRAFAIGSPGNGVASILTVRSSSACTRPDSPTSREAHTRPSVPTKPTTTIGCSSRNSRAAGGRLEWMLLPTRSAIERTLTRSCTSISPGGTLHSPRADYDGPFYVLRRIHLTPIQETRRGFRGKERSMQIEGLDHLVLTVVDVGRTRDFYERVLGMEPVVFGESRHALAFGAQKINLHEAGREFEP